MLYRPPKPIEMWDSWIFPWQGRYHLFHLETQDTQWDHVGRAVSDDLIRWERLDAIPTRGAQGSWDHGPTLTGCTVHHGGRFYLFVGSYDPTFKNPGEMIGVYISDDLKQWRPHPDNPILCARGPYYTADPAKAPYVPVDWAGPHIAWREEDKRFHGILSARRPGWNQGDHGMLLGHIASDDLINWEYLPPFAEVGNRFFNAEVPDFFPLNGRHYILFNTGTYGGIRLNSATRRNALGLVYMVASEFEGPYEMPEDPILLAAGNHMPAPYVTRTVDFQDQKVFYHQSGGGKYPALWPPKKVCCEDDGTLWPGYFSGLESLHADNIISAPSDMGEMECRDPGLWQRRDGVIVAESMVAGSTLRIAEEMDHYHLQFKVNLRSARCAGAILRVEGVERGAHVLLDAEQGQIQIGTASDGHGHSGPFKQATVGWTLKMIDNVRCPVSRDKDHHVRCFVRHEHLEVYLDDRWMFSTVFGDDPMPEQGAIELIIEAGQAVFSDIRLDRIEAMR